MEGHSLDLSELLIAAVSFEGPDRASQAGGLGVRVAGLTETLASLGAETHLFFMGDPALPGEQRIGERLVLHRWGQWISKWHPGGVYDGEEQKRRDLVASLPAYLTDHILLPAIQAGRLPIVLCEEWQTAECASEIGERLEAHGAADKVILVWNANNAYSFDRIDWARLARSSIITTVSQYMRSIIRARGFDAIVIPNGIPDRLTNSVSRFEVTKLLAALSGVQLFFKMARWGPDKGWVQAFEAIRILRARGRRTLLVARAGGPAGAGGDLSAEASRRGLDVVECHDEQHLVEACLTAVKRDASVVSLRFGVTEAKARTLFAAADGVLANSVSEPFGLVGLEAMAAGGVIYTGGTGEDYAVSGRNAVVLGTLDAAEIADRAEELSRSPRRVQRIRRNARESARRYTWPAVAAHLLGVLAESARRGSSPQSQEALPILERVSVTETRPLSRYRPLVSPISQQSALTSR